MSTLREIGTEKHPLTAGLTSRRDSVRETKIFYRETVLHSCLDHLRIVSFAW
jgi:hypothetical protein